MALVTRTCLAALLAVTLAVGCDERSRLREAALGLHTALECTTRQQCAREAGTRRPAPELLEGRVFVSRRDSAHAYGVYFYLEFVRTSGARVVVEADLPTEPGGGAVRATYREYRAGQLVFASSRGAGWIEVSEALLGSGSPCPGGGGLAELRFTAPGADGKHGTADDLVRRISDLWFGARDDAVSRSRPLASPITVSVIRCPAAASGGGGGGGGGAASGADVDVGAGCGFDDGGGWDDDDDWGDSDWGDSDSGDSGGSDSSWEGDSWDGGDSDWEGDSWDASPPPDALPDRRFNGPGRGAPRGAPRRPGRRPRPGRPERPALPFLLLGAFGGLLRSRG